jgi:ABC-type uncharacterized transport system involved in gliding motility auxiliary subunit
MKDKQTNRFMAGKLGKRSVYFATILSAAALLLILNGVVTLLAEYFPVLRFDLTKTKLFELSAQTAEQIQGIKDKVTVYVLAREETFTDTSEYNALANEVIRQFGKTNGASIEVVYVDYVKDPTFAASYPNLIMKHGDILVVCGEKNSLVKTEDLFNYVVGPAGELSIASSRAEEAIYTAILSVTSGSPIPVTVITGHGEYTMSDFYSLLEKNNYTIASQNLVTGSIDPAARIVLITAPKSDFSEGELEKLDEFLLSGGQYGKIILYCADAEQPDMPVLSGFLREWGVMVDDGAVFETNDRRVYNYHPFYAIADYAEGDYSGMLRNMEKPMLMPVSRPLTRTFEYRNNYSAKILLEFAASAGVRPSNAPGNFTADDAVRRGPLPALILSSYSVLNRQTARVDKASHVLISGSAGMLDGYAVNNPSFSNAEYLVNILNSLSGRRDIIAFRPKSFGAAGLMLSRTAVNVLGGVLIILIPVLLILGGIIIWIRRSGS